MERLGVATAAEVGVETLMERFRNEGRHLERLHWPLSDRRLVKSSAHDCRPHPICVRAASSEELVHNADESCSFVPMRAQMELSRGRGRLAGNPGQHVDLHIPSRTIQERRRHCDLKCGGIA
jgi:hypothetical protein